MDEVKNKAHHIERINMVEFDKIDHKRVEKLHQKLVIKNKQSTQYKDRKDIGSTKARSEREQQPEKERGSKEVKQSYADKVKAERRAAARARIAAKKPGGEVKKEAPKKNTEKEASKLLSKKKEKTAVGRNRIKRVSRESFR